MTKDKFYNETYETTLMVVVYDQSSKKDCNKLEKFLIKYGMDKSEVYECIHEAIAFCDTLEGFILICFDKNYFKGNKKTEQAIVTIAHECGHFRGRVLKHIGETVTVTDSEVYSRISDWAVKKCVSVKYFKKFFKKQK